MKKTKRYITLLEIMIVIFLISVIGGVIGYNMKGSLDRGKVFATKQAKRQLKDILELHLISNDLTTKDLKANAKKYLEESGLVAKPDDLLKDGWGQPFDIKVVNGSIKISSSSYKKYKANKKTK